MLNPAVMNDRLAAARQVKYHAAGTALGVEVRQLNRRTVVPRALLLSGPAGFDHVTGTGVGVPLVDFAVQRIQQADRGAADAVEAQAGAAEELAARTGVAEQPLFVWPLVVLTVEDQVGDFGPARIHLEQEFGTTVRNQRGRREIAEVNHRAGNAEEALLLIAKVTAGHKEGACRKLYADLLVSLERPLIHGFDRRCRIGFAVGDGAEVKQRQAVEIFHHAAPVESVAAENHAAIIFAFAIQADELAAAHFQPFVPAFQLDFRPGKQRSGFTQLFHRRNFADQLIAVRLRQALAEVAGVRARHVADGKQRIALVIFHHHRVRGIGD